jgi:hypothetical protein
MQVVIAAILKWAMERAGAGFVLIVVLGFVWHEEQNTQGLSQANAESIAALSEQVETLTAQMKQMAIQVEGITQSLYKMEYIPSYEIIKLGLAGLSHEEAIAKIKFWVAEGWVAKIANLTKLCEEPGRNLLIKLAGNQARAGDYCRAMH